MSTQTAQKQSKPLQQLAELRGALKSPYMPWNTIVELVMSHAGLPLTISIATDPQYKIPDNAPSLALDLGHETLKDLITRPSGSNGLGMSWKVWTDHVKATILAERYSIRPQDISVKKLIQNDKEVTEHLGRYAGTSSEWHATRVKIEQLEYRTMASRISAQSRKHRQMGRKILEKYSAAAASLAKAEKKIETLDSQLGITEQALLSAQSKHRSEIDRYENDAVENLYRFNRERESLKSEISELSQQRESLYEQVLLHADERMTLLKEVSDLKLRTQDYEDLQKILKDNEQQLVETLSANIDISDINAQLKADLAAATARNSDQISKIKRLQDTVNSQIIINESLRASLHTSRNSIIKLENKVDEVRSLLDQEPLAVERERQLREQTQEKANKTAAELIETQQQLLEVQEKLSFTEQLLVEENDVFASKEKSIYYKQLNESIQQLDIEKSDHAYTKAALQSAIDESDAKELAIRAQQKRLKVFSSVIHDLKAKSAEQKALIGEDLCSLIECQKGEIARLELKRESLEAQIGEYQQRIDRLKSIIRKAIDKLARVNKVLNQRRRYIRSANNFIRIQTKSIEINSRHRKKRDFRMLVLASALLASVGLLTLSTDAIQLDNLYKWKQAYANDAKQN
tara:strand:- start:8912 stop:10810 length:1899 start_codon:yes stop_codon:yes gene_type:complete